MNDCFLMESVTAGEQASLDDAKVDEIMGLSSSEPWMYAVPLPKEEMVLPEPIAYVIREGALARSSAEAVANPLPAADDILAAVSKQIKRFGRHRRTAP